MENRIIDKAHEIISNYRANSEIIDVEATTNELAKLYPAEDLHKIRQMIFEAGVQSGANMKWGAEQR